MQEEFVRLLNDEAAGNLPSAGGGAAGNPAQPGSGEREIQIPVTPQDKEAIERVSQQADSKDYIIIT